MFAPHATHTTTPELERTLQLLSKVNNDAAVEALLPGLDSPHAAIQEGALSALLERRSPRGQREILARLHNAGTRWREIIEDNKGRMTHALRDGVLGQDARLGTNACQAILWFREYDLVPVLLQALEDDAHPRGKLAAETLVALADMLFEDLAAAPRDLKGSRDPQLIRQRVVGSLEASVRRYSHHQRAEVMNAFVLLAHRDNVTLKQILQDPHHGTFVPLVEALLHNPRPGVVQLVLSFLDDPYVPSAALSVLMRRHDAKFTHALLRKIGHGVSPIMGNNLKRMQSFACLRTEPAALAQLDEAGQQALVHLTIASGMRRTDVFKIIEYLGLHGKPAARIAAVRALANFQGAEADALVMRALEDQDPQIQAAALGQLRQRGTPGALTRLIEMIDAPHECVRQAAREGLAEFKFDRFVAAFDMLDEEVRRTTGILVHKVDPDAIRLLGVEMKAQVRARRLRALAMAETMGVIAALERDIIELLGDEDHLVRGEAARALAHCPGPAAGAALREALADRSISVQEAVAASLDVWESRAVRNAAHADKGHKA